MLLFYFYSERPVIWPKMLTGLLAAQGMKAAEARVGKSLRETHPQNIRLDNK